MCSTVSLDSLKDDPRSLLNLLTLQRLHSLRLHGAGAPLLLMQALYMLLAFPDHTSPSYFTGLCCTLP